MGGGGQSILIPALFLLLGEDTWFLKKQFQKKKGFY